MSYILDALKKADAQRELGAVPDLYAHALQPGRANAAAPRRWLGLVLAEGVPLLQPEALREVLALGVKDGFFDSVGEPVGLLEALPHDEGVMVREGLPEPELHSVGLVLPVPVRVAHADAVREDEAVKEPDSVGDGHGEVVREAKEGEFEALTV